MNGKIFLSYRRGDSAAMAGRLHDRLNALFPGRVFLDVESIQPGEDFLYKIKQNVNSGCLLIVLIGKHWLSSTNGLSRLGDPTDYVTVEIETAIERKVPIIPVLLDGAVLPDEKDIPTEPLKILLRRNVLEIRHTSFERDSMFLGEKIYKHVGIQPPTKLEELVQTLASKFGYSGFRYDEKNRGWHAVLALILGGIAAVNTILAVVGIMSIDLEILFLTVCSVFPGVIGKNSSTKRKLAIIGLTLTLISFLVQFSIFELHAILSS